jgi:hypothetical protein
VRVTRHVITLQICSLLAEPAPCPCISTRPSEASNELKGNYPASMKDFDQAMGHMLMVADVLSNGIIAQFPSKFSEAGGKK